MVWMVTGKRPSTKESPGPASLAEDLTITRIRKTAELIIPKLMSAEQLFAQRGSVV